MRFIQSHQHTHTHVLTSLVFPATLPKQTTQVALVQFLEGNDGFREAPMTLDDEGHMAKKVQKEE
jgi:hypothetical protein